MILYSYDSGHIFCVKSDIELSYSISLLLGLEMQIFINGESRDIPDDLKMDALIALLGLKGQRLAIEVNEELVPRSRFADHALNEQDAVEIIHAVGGG